jgi:uncharacterized protein (TIGR00725 family)
MAILLFQFSLSGKKMQIAVVGGGACSPEVRDTAKRLGQIIASHGHVLICGGLGGVMEAACCGAREAGGLCVGILPGKRQEANTCVDVTIATGMGHARNAIIVKSADVVIALPGELGTLSEMALAMKMNKPVISLNSWEICGAFQVEDPEEVAELLDRIDLCQKEQKS